MPNTKPVGVAYSDPALDGAIVGATGGTVGFYGTTPITKPALALTTTALAALTTSAVCAMNTTQLQTLQTTVNNLVLTVQQLGLSS